MFARGAAREFKQSEGDPHIKGRLKQIRAERARRRMMADVPKADVVITNPTHFAVALKYEQATMSAPRVVAKGADVIAARFARSRKPTRCDRRESAACARALRGRRPRRGDPAEHYRAVAEVIGYVMRLKGRLGDGPGASRRNPRRHI